MLRRWSSAVRWWAIASDHKVAPQPPGLLHNPKRGIVNSRSPRVLEIIKFGDAKLVDLVFPQEELIRGKADEEQESWKHRTWKFLEIPSTFERLWGMQRGCKPLILARDCYKPILEIVMEFCGRDFFESVVMSGSPGIGKSGFIFYMLWHLLSREQRDSWCLVILKFHDSDKFYVFSQSAGDLVCRYSQNGNDVSKLVDKLVSRSYKPIWYLADWKIKVEHHKLACRKVLFCSPDEDNYRQFAKSRFVKMCYVPVWSRAELLALNHMAFGLDSVIVNKRYDMYGGIPRYVLAEDERKVAEDVEVGVRKVREKLLQTRSLVNSGPEEVCKSNSCHRVYKLDVDPSYGCVSVSFTSSYMATRISESVDPKVLHDIFNRRPSSDSGQAMLADLFDACFQQYWCCNNGRFKYRCMDLCTETLRWVNLKEESVHKNVKMEVWPMRSPTKVRYPEHVDRNHMEETICKPESKYQDGWDALFGRQVIQASTTMVRKVEFRDSLKEAKAFLEKVYGVPQSHEEWFELVLLVPASQFEDFEVSLVDGAMDRKKGRPTNQQRLERLKVFNDAKMKVVKMAFGDGNTDFDGAMTRAVASQLQATLKVGAE